MSSKSQVNVSSHDDEAGESGQENVLRRVASMPLVSSAYDMAATAYHSTKDNHPYVKSLCDAAEKGMKTLTEVAINTAQPILTKLEPQIAAVNEYASSGLDTLEEKLPILQMTADKVASDTKEMVSAKMASAKEAIASKLSGVVGMTREAVQDGMEATKSAIGHSLTMVMESRVGQIAASGAEAVLDRSEDLIDEYLPITDEELAEITATVKDGDVVPVQQHEQQKYLVRLGSLSSRLRHRAYLHSVAKIKQARQRIHESLSQLQQIIYLIEHMKNGVGQKFHEGEKKLSQMLLEWNKANPEAKDDTDGAQLEVENQTLTMFHNMIQHLQTTSQTLMSSIQGFPSNLQDKMQQVLQSSRELHASFSTVRSFQELSTTLLAQSHQTVQKAQEYMDELLEYVAYNTPLSWLVGPFILSAKLSMEAVE
ncbi:perilipin-3-like isoform X2 [Rhineura floridana]|uniref:perilipin-3-like isoform X2 n=1 Tax=Rhineura floridana TaxID=261503 RepID=UPI002AC8533F|nr:perilipin-3-like isoform X2 [Rhineura floridana]